MTESECKELKPIKCDALRHALRLNCVVCRLLPVALIISGLMTLTDYMILLFSFQGLKIYGAWLRNHLTAGKQNRWRNLLNSPGCWQTHRSPYLISTDGDGMYTDPVRYGFSICWSSCASELRASHVWMSYKTEINCQPVEFPFTGHLYIWSISWRTSAELSLV